MSLSLSINIDVCVYIYIYVYACIHIERVGSREAPAGFPRALAKRDAGVPSAGGR